MKYYLFLLDHFDEFAYVGQIFCNGPKQDSSTLLTFSINCASQSVSRIAKGHERKLAVFVSCVLCLRSAFCVMLGAKTMLGATENMEFINILSLNTIFVILQVT